MEKKEKKTILVVDDDKTILESLKKVLQSEGYSVYTAENGGEALEKLETQYFNLALLDIRLPDMNGTELLVTIHRDAPKIMTIMITGYPNLENAVKSLNLGADAYLMKPINPEELLNVIQEKLKEQGEVMKMSEEKVAKWIETRIRKLERE